MRYCCLILLTIIAGELIFLTSCSKDSNRTHIEYGEITDIDGNSYKTVKIGDQWWMAENLKTKKFNDGTQITEVTDLNNWNGLHSPAYHIGNYYGNTLFYNWYTVKKGNLCPDGWHVPTLNDWKLLIDYLGGENVAGGKMKTSSWWRSPNTGATNSSGFSASPEGWFYAKGYAEIGMPSEAAAFWSNQPYDTIFAYSCHLYFGSAEAYISQRTFYQGLTVRCTNYLPSVINIPSLTTLSITSFTHSSVNCGGNISNDGYSDVIFRGICYSSIHTPTLGDSIKEEGPGIGSFRSSITALKPNTTYYLRAYATNAKGTAYGNQVIFKTMTTKNATATDIEGNIYNTVTIGAQIWMMENLRVTKYTDNTRIPLVTDDIAWLNLSTPGYCYYNNDSTTHKPAYGALYNWYTVNTGKFCPTGWHVPSSYEWTLLLTHLGDNSVGNISPWANYTSFTGCKLKETGTTHWTGSNSCATNESGFTALPGGLRSSSNTTSEFYYIGSNCIWWTSTEWGGGTPEYNVKNATYTRIYPDGLFMRYLSQKKEGYSVRCIKD